MDTNKTIYDDVQKVSKNNATQAQPAAEPVMANQPDQLNDELEGDDKSNLKKRAAVLGAAVFGGGIIGAGASILAGNTMQSAEPANATEQSDLKVIDEPGSRDFESAFNDARLTLGPGAAFRWHGGIYSTYTKEEWAAMSAEERAAYQDKVNGVAHGSEREASTYAHNSHDHHHSEDSHNSHEKSNHDIHEKTNHDIHNHPKPTPASDKIQILEEGASEIDGQPVIVARAIHNGKEVILIDADRDGVYDVEAYDANNDNQLQKNEVFSLQGQNIRVQDPSLLEGNSDVQIVVDGNEHIENIDGHQMIVDSAKVGGHQAIVVDVNQDGTYDYAMVDLNNNGKLEEGEQFSIVNENIHVKNPQLVDVAQTDQNLNPAGSNYPDYVNTASMNDSGEQQTDDDKYAYQNPEQQGDDDGYAYQNPDTADDTVTTDDTVADTSNDIAMDDTMATDDYDPSADMYDGSENA